MALRHYFIALLLVSCIFLYLARFAEAGRKNDLADLEEDVSDEEEETLDDEDATPKRGTPKTAPARAETPPEPKRTVADNSESENDDESFYDDEDDGFASDKEKEKEKKKAVLAQTPAPEERPRYYVEMVALVFVVVYFINFFIGRRTNDAIAQRWCVRAIEHELCRQLVIVTTIIVEADDCVAGG